MQTAERRAAQESGMLLTLVSQPLYNWHNSPLSTASELPPLVTLCNCSAHFMMYKHANALLTILAMKLSRSSYLHHCSHGADC